MYNLLCLLLHFRIRVQGSVVLVRGNSRTIGGYIQDKLVNNIRLVIFIYNKITLL